MVLVDGLHRQLDLAAVVEAEDLHLHLVADLDHVRHLLDPLGPQLGDVDEAVASRGFDEGAEVHHLE